MSASQYSVQMIIPDRSDLIKSIQRLETIGIWQSTRHHYWIAIISYLTLCHCLDFLQTVRLKDSPQKIRNTCRSCEPTPGGRYRNCYHLWFGKTGWTQFNLPCRAPRKTFWPCHFNKHIQSVKQNQTNQFLELATTTVNSPLIIKAPSFWTASFRQ